MRARRLNGRKLTIKKLLVWLSIALLALGVGRGYEALTSDLPTLQSSQASLAELPAEDVIIAWPNVGEAAFGTTSSGVLATSSEIEVIKPIASIAKIVTALAILQEKPISLGEPGAVLTLDSTDVGYYNSYHAKGGSVARVTAGEQLTQYEALEALLIPSANNIADSLVRWTFGSMEAYKTYANNMVKGFGLNKTVVDDASGFSSSTVSTPSELIILGQKALQNPVIAEIVAKKEAVIPVAGTIKNVNSLLSDSKVIGIKTGTTDEAGGCLLFASKYVFDDGNGVTVIGVVLGTPSPVAAFQSSRALLETVYKGFSKQEVVKAGTIVGSYTSEWGQVTDLVAKDTLVAYRWRGTPLQPLLLISKASAPLVANQTIGQIELSDSLGDSSVTVITKDAVPKPSNFWRLRHLF